MIPFNVQGKGVLEIAGFTSISYEEKWKKEELVNNEPTSVLHMRRSPSPPTSASTLSSSLGGGGGVPALHPETTAGSRKDEWASELQPIPSGLRCVGLEDWDSVMSESAASLSQEQSLLRWIAGDVDETSFGGLKQLLQSGNDFDGNAGLGIFDQGHGFEQIGVSGTVSSTGDPNLAFPGSGFSSNSNNGNVKIGSSSIAPSSFGHKTCGVGFSIPNLTFSSAANNFPSTSHPLPDEKPQVLNWHHQQLQHSQNPSFFMPLPFTGQLEQQLVHPQPKRQELLLPKHQHQNQHLGLQYNEKVMRPGEEMAPQQALLDQLYQAAEQVGSGNFSHAQAILARLNHQLSPAGNPFHRAAFYFKEALQLLLPRTPAPFDVIFKMGAYKVFSEISPLLHFVNFTSNQVLLEALSDAHRIHIFDFDIGFGAQWASFIQELPVRNSRASSLKITAFASPSTHHPIQLQLMRENLTQFAFDIGLNFELQVVNFDSYSLPMFLSSENEAVAVNFPIWSSADQPSALPALLRFVKQLSPKIVVSLDRGGCDRSDLPFPQHLLHALQSYIHLLESLDAVNANPDSVNKIERFLFQPRIESTVLGRLRSPEKMPLWRTLFASTGFSPVPFSNFTETQAECLVRRTPVRGFHVEKRQSSLMLYWQNRELISASAWQC